MAYLESNLGRDEQIISKAEVNFATTLSDIIIGMIAGAVVSLFIPIMGIVITIAIIILFSNLRKKNTELGLTNKKVMGKYGLINTKIMDSPINKINSITVEQGLGGKIFGYGKIVISTSSGGYSFNFIKNADSFRSAVMEQIDLFDEERVRKQAEQLANAMKQ